MNLDYSKAKRRESEERKNKNIEIVLEYEKRYWLLGGGGVRCKNNITFVHSHTNVSFFAMATPPEHKKTRIPFRISEDSWIVHYEHRDINFISRAHVSGLCSCMWELQATHSLWQIISRVKWKPNCVYIIYLHEKLNWIQIWLQSNISV